MFELAEHVVFVLLVDPVGNLLKSIFWLAEIKLPSGVSPRSISDKKVKAKHTRRFQQYHEASSTFSAAEIVCAIGPRISATEMRVDV